MPYLLPGFEKKIVKGHLTIHSCEF